MDDIENLQQSGSVQTGSQTTALFLALYLLVLAFFIVLVTISSVEDVKSKAVMDSLTSTFTSLLPPTTDLTVFASRDGDLLAGEAFQEELASLFATTIQVAKVEIVQPGRLMRVSLPADSLFMEESTKIRDAQIPLLDRVVASLSSASPGLRHDMEFLVGSPTDKQGDLPTGETLEMARAGAFARVMLARGVPPHSVSVGLRPGRADEIVMRFFVRPENEAQVRFTKAEEPAETTVTP